MFPDTFGKPLIPFLIIATLTLPFPKDANASPQRRRDERCAETVRMVKETAQSGCSVVLSGDAWLASAPQSKQGDFASLNFCPKPVLPNATNVQPLASSIFF